MKHHKIYFTRYQTSHDSNLRKVAKIMREAGLLHRYFINRSHLTSVIIHQGDHPITVLENSDLLAPYEGTERANVLAIIAQNSERTETESVGSIPTDGQDSGMEQ